MHWGWAMLLPAYALGTFPTALLVGRREGRDVTREGSGNPGASNALRTMGRRAGVLVLLGDLGKGIVATAGAWLLAGGWEHGRGIGVGCGIAAVVGHIFPVTRRFRGGKGVATGAGLAVVLLPIPSIGLAALFGVVVKLTRVAALGSVAVAVALPVLDAAAGRPGAEVAALAACSALVVARHRDNLTRLRSGDEHTIG